MDRWPVLCGELRDALLADGESDLACTIPTLEVVGPCECGDSFCQSFYTAPKPDGAYGPGHRNVAPRAPWAGMLILDVVDEGIAFVEVIDREPLDRLQPL